MNKDCHTLINAGVEQLIDMVAQECTALDQRGFGAFVRSELFWLQWQQRGSLRCFFEWHILRPHKRFSPGHALRPDSWLQWINNVLARRQNGYLWLQALEKCLEENGIAISTEYFAGGFTTSSAIWIKIRPFMTVRGRFYNLVREYALMKLYPEHFFSGDPKVEECHAQTVAFAVAKAVGLASPYHSKHYIVGTCGYADTIRESGKVLTDLGTDLLTQLFRHYKNTAGVTIRTGDENHDSPSENRGNR